MNDQTLSADHDVSGERNRAKKNPNHAYDWRLIFDLERLMHYASTAKEVDVPIHICSDATAALQTAKTQMQNDGSLASATQMSLLKAIDDLSPKIYPVTTASLEIADALDVAKPDPSHQQLEIRRRIYKLTNFWIWCAMAALLAVFVMTAFTSDKSAAGTPHAAFFGIGYDVVRSFATFVDPIILGFLGACAYILRSILQRLANQTFVFRDGASYALRAILGMILGFIIPHLIGASSQFGFLLDVALPFLAGYAVEPMFAALDTIVTTLSEAVSRSPTAGASRAK
jgi:VanZ family protein